MALLYKGDGTTFINDMIAGHIPAHDLDDSEVESIAKLWNLSLAETEGLLIKHGLYAMPPKEEKWTAKPSSQFRTDFQDNHDSEEKEV